MVLEPYKRAFLWRHCCSVVTAVFLLLTSVVFVSGRVKAAREGQIPSPPVPNANLTAALRTSTCSCSCTAEGSLLCNTTSSAIGTKTLTEGGENPKRFNKTGCVDSWLRSPWELGPTPVAEHCYCSEAANSTRYTCRVHFIYSKEKVDVVLTTANTHLGVMLVAIVWDLFYVYVRYWRVLPQAKSEEIDALWSAWWLHSYWDVVHGATLWLIWGQVAPLTFAPMGMISSYPPLRYFGPNPAWHERTATGLDEVFLWCAVFMFCLTSLLATIRPVSPGVVEDELVASSMSVDAMRRRSLARGGATSSTQSICATLFCSAILSIGFVVGQPASSVYSLIATVPLWVVVMFHQQSSTWPLERPMPSWKEPWSLRPVDAAMQQNALQTCSDVKNILLSMERVPKVSSLCNTAAFLHAKYPWRTRSQLEDQLQELLLDALRTAVEGKDVAAMRHLMCAARVLGYQPPRDTEEDDSEDHLPPKRRKTCCSRFVAYQHLDDVEQADNMCNSDDNWNAEITRILRTALRSAVQTAQVLDDDETSLRWLGVMLATIYPEAVSVLPGLLARASVCLEIAMEHPDSDDAKEVDIHELSRLAAAAVKLVPDTEGPSHTSAFTWAMNLQGRQQHRSMEVMLSRIPQDPLHRHHRDSITLEVVGGSRSSVIIGGGLKVCTLEADTVIGAPDLIVPRGCWFYELRLYGFQQQIRRLHGEQAEGVWTPLCRFGWFHEGHRIGGSVFESGGALCSASSCDLPSLCGSSIICPSTGVIGCALEVQEGNTYKACYAFNGAWHGGRGGQSQVGTVEVSWLANASDGPVFPAVSGQVAFEMIFDADLFVYGPPSLNGKYRPLTEIDRPTVIGRSVA